MTVDVRCRGWLGMSGLEPFYVKRYQRY